MLDMDGVKMDGAYADAHEKLNGAIRSLFVAWQNNDESSRVVPELEESLNWLSEAVNGINTEILRLKKNDAKRRAKARKKLDLSDETFRDFSWKYARRNVPGLRRWKQMTQRKADNAYQRLASRYASVFLGDIKEAYGAAKNEMRVLFGLVRTEDGTWRSI